MTGRTYEDFPFVGDLIYPGQGGAYVVCKDCGSLIPIPDFGYEDYPGQTTYLEAHESACPWRNPTRTRIPMEPYDEEAALASIQDSLNKNKVAPGQEWRLIENVTCVQCPRCSFVMDEVQVNDDGSGYTCPECGYS